MNRRDYWRGRYLQIRAANELSTIRFERDMLATVDSLNTKINRELVDWYKRYARTGKVDFDTAAGVLKKARTDDWHTTLSEFQRLAIEGGHTDELDLEYIRSQVARMEQLQIQLVSTIAPVLPELTNSMSDEMVEQYRYQYEHAMYLNEMASGNVGHFASYDDRSLKLVVAKPWQEGDFSRRIWGNMQSTLPNMLMKTLAESVVLGRSSKRLAHELAQTSKQFGESNLHRLINTEMAHIDEEANFQALTDIDAEWYEYLATLESHTCSICAKLDEHHFKMADRKDGVNFPPIHPYCRCDTVYWEPNMPDVGKRWSRDNDGKRHMVDDETFEEWKTGKRKPKTPVAQPTKPVKRRYRDVMKKTLKASEKYLKSLPKEQVDAVKSYTGNAYTALNRHFRKGTKLGKNTEALIPNLDAALNHELGQDAIVYRGMNKIPDGWLSSMDADASKQLKRVVSKITRGKVTRDSVSTLNQVLKNLGGLDIEEPGYLSTTHDKQATKKFSSNIMLDLSVPGEAHGVAVESVSNYTSEAEILFARGAKIQVNGFEVSENGSTLILKGVLSNG